MSMDYKDLINLIISGGDEKLKSALKELENNHNLEAAFQALLHICKKSLLGADMRPCMVPFIKRYLSTLPIAKTTIIAAEVVQFCNAEYSLKLSVQLIRLLSETAQLGNAVKFRQFIKTRIVELQNQLFDENFSVEADLLLVAVSNVLMFELNFLDNINEKNTMEIWKNLKKKDSTINHFASYLIHTVLNDSEIAKEHELAICEADEFDRDFVDYCQSYLHVPLSMFKQENVFSFITKMIKYYLENKKLDELYELVFKVPELRNNLSPNVSFVLITSTLNVLWERIAKGKKRKSDETGEFKNGIKKLLRVISQIQSANAIDNDVFQQLFFKCCKAFTKFAHQKEMKATFFVDCLLSVQEMIPFLDINTKLLLIAILPFVFGVGGTEEKFIQIFKIYAILLAEVPQEYLTMMATQQEVIGDLLDVMIRKYSKNSSELKYYCGKVVHCFLYSDKNFMKLFVKNEKNTDFETLLITFNKVARPITRILRSEVSTVFQICLFFYEQKFRNVKGEEFKSKPRFKFLVDSLVEWIKLASPELSMKNSTFIVLLVDLTTIFVQFVRLCKNVEIEVEDSKIIFPVLKQLFVEEDGLNLIVESEKSFVVNLLLEKLIFCARSLDFGNFFFDLKMLINLATYGFIKNETLKKLTKFMITTNKEWNWKEKLMELFPAEKLTIKSKNAVYRFLTIIVELELMEKKTSDFDYYIFLLFVKMQKGSIEAMEFAAAYLPTIEKQEKFGNLLASSVMACANCLALQTLTKEFENTVTEIKRSTAAVHFIDALTRMSPKVMINQIHIVGQLISKLIFNLTTFRQVVYECRENPKRRQEIKEVYDYYLKQLAVVCRKISKSKELAVQLPFVIANCLTGEREQNLPTFYLLAGCDIHALSFLSTNLPTERKRRFAITFPNFMVQNRFTG